MPKRILASCAVLYGVLLLFTALMHQCAIAQPYPTAPDPTPPDPVALEDDAFLSRASLVLGLGLGAGALAREEFDDADRIAKILDNSPIQGAFDAADIYGSGTAMGVTSLSLLAIGRATDNPRVYELGKDLSKSLLLTWSAVWALKLTINAKRPNGGDYAFPSGHTATAFATAPVLGKHFGPRAAYASYAMGVLTGLARMEDKKHYLGDCLAGAAVGLILSREITTQSDPGWMIGPAFPRLGVSVRF